VIGYLKKVFLKNMKL